MKSLFVAYLTLLLLVLVLTGAESGSNFNCEVAKKSLLPCLEYLTGGGGGNPSNACCNAINAVNSSTPTKETRREACECLREVGRHYHNIREDLAASLAKRCGLNVGFIVGKNINCNDIP